jgi:hypothetical protein
MLFDKGRLIIITYPVFFWFKIGIAISKLAPLIFFTLATALLVGFISVCPLPPIFYPALDLPY